MPTPNPWYKRSTQVPFLLPAHYECQTLLMRPVAGLKRKQTHSSPLSSSQLTITTNPSLCTLWQNWRQTGPPKYPLCSLSSWRLRTSPSILWDEFSPPSPNLSGEANRAKESVGVPWVQCPCDMCGIWYAHYLICLKSKRYLIRSVADKFGICSVRYLKGSTGVVDTQCHWLRKNHDSRVSFPPLGHDFMVSLTLLSHNSVVSLVPLSHCWCCWFNCLKFKKPYFFKKTF